MSQRENLDTERLLRDWRWLCPQPTTVIDRNAFGDLFLSDGTGKVHQLDIGTGECVVIADSVNEFVALSETSEKREQWFQESALKAAMKRGLVPGLEQCIAFKIPVVFAEGRGLDNAYIADLYEQVGFLGGIHRQIANLPEGAKVKLVVKHDADRQ